MKLEGRLTGIDWVLLASVLVATIAIVPMHAQLVHFFCDDAYISFRYSQNFAEGNGLVYNVGERVEGYTNFLWVFLVGVLMKCGMGAETAALALGIFSLVAALKLAAVLTYRFTGSVGWSAFPLVLIATSGPMILWSVGGLEGILFAAAVLAAFTQYERARTGRGHSLLFAGALYGLATLVRPDGAVFGGAAGLHLIASRLLDSRSPGSDGHRRLIPDTVRLAGGYALVVLPHMLFRILYYGDWLPNTYYVKSAGEEKLAHGMEYLRSFAAEYQTLLLAAVIGALLALIAPSLRRVRGATLHMLLAVLLFGAYVTFGGGDYMALYRFYVPIIPFLAILASLLLYVVGLTVTRLTGQPILALLLVLPLLTGLAWVNYQPSIASEAGIKKSAVVAPIAGMRTNSANWAAAGRALGNAFWPDAMLATSAAGAIPFFSGLPTLDQSGLNDRYTAKEAWDPWTINKPGHTKMATKEYILRRNPALILAHPKIWSGNSIHRTNNPWPKYILRAVAIPELLDPEGDQLYLYFWLRRDLAERAKERGIIPPPSPNLR